MDQSYVSHRIQEYLKVSILKKPDYDLKVDEPLFTSGLIDSYSIALIAVFIEDEFSIHIDEVDLTVENVDTIHAILALIEANAS